jgi:hypothetical protein
MLTIIMFLSQTRPWATIEILAILLGAGIIGHLTAWLYYRSIYMARIKEIEYESKKLDKQVDKLDLAKVICTMIFVKRMKRWTNDSRR